MLQVAAAGTADSGREVESTTSAFVTWSVTRMSAMSTSLCLCAVPAYLSTVSATAAAGDADVVQRHLSR